jgi:hypothetical protein
VQTSFRFRVTQGITTQPASAPTNPWPHVAHCSASSTLLSERWTRFARRRMLDFLPLLLAALLILSYAFFRAFHDTDPDRDEPPISNDRGGESFYE